MPKGRPKSFLDVKQDLTEDNWNQLEVFLTTQKIVWRIWGWGGLHSRKIFSSKIKKAQFISSLVCSTLQTTDRSRLCSQTFKTRRELFEHLRRTFCMQGGSTVVLRKRESYPVFDPGQNKKCVAPPYFFHIRGVVGVYTYPFLLIRREKGCYRTEC